MSLFLQAVRQPRRAPRPAQVSQQLAQIRDSVRAAEPEPAPAPELALAPETQREPSDEPAERPATRPAAQTSAESTPAPPQPATESTQAPPSAPDVPSAETDAAPILEQPVNRDAPLRVSSIAMIEPMLLLVAAVAAIGLLSVVYLLFAGATQFADSERALLDREMRTVQVQLDELRALDTLGDGPAEQAPPRELESPAATAVAATELIPVRRADPGEATAVPLQSALPASTAADTDNATADNATAGGDAVLAELAQLKAQLSSQSARIDQLSAENARLQALVAKPRPVAKPAADAARNVVNTADASRGPIVSVTEQPARATPAARVDGAQTGVGARAIDDLAIDVDDRFLLLMRQGYAAYQSGDYARADSLYDQALLLEPYNRDANLAVASVARKLNDHRRAEIRYRHLLSLDGQDSAAFSGLLDVAAALDDDAIEHEMASHIGTIETPGRMYAALGNYYSARRSWLLARDAWRDALAHDVSNPDYAFNLAVSLDNLQRHNSAIGYYQQALEHAGARTFHFDKPATRSRLETLIAARDS